MIIPIPAINTFLHSKLQNLWIIVLQIIFQQRNDQRRGFGHEGAMGGGDRGEGAGWGEAFVPHLRETETSSIATPPLTVNVVVVLLVVMMAFA